MTKRKFMVIDLGLFTMIGIFLQFIEHYAIRLAPSILFYLSFSLIIVLIAMYRWGSGGLLVGVIPVLIECAMVEASFKQYLIYLFGMLPLILNLVWFTFLKKEKMSASPFAIILYTISGYLLVLIGRSALSVIFSFDFIIAFNQFILNEVLSIAIGCIVMLITYAQKSILVDINQYLIQLHKEGEMNES